MNLIWIKNFDPKPSTEIQRIGKSKLDTKNLIMEYANGQF